MFFSTKAEVGRARYELLLKKKKKLPLHPAPMPLCLCATLMAVGIEVL